MSMSVNIHIFINLILNTIAVGDDENDNKYIIIPVISASVFVILVVVALFIGR